MDGQNQQNPTKDDDGKSPRKSSCVEADFQGLVQSDGANGEVNLVDGTDSQGCSQILDQLDAVQGNITR